jgi:hypothetical protein
MRSDPRGDFRRDMRSESTSGAPASAEIERDIDRTRSRMDQTVDTLADRLRPSSIVGDILDWFATEEGTRTDAPRKEKAKRVARRAGRGVWETVRENPMPSALIAGGIAWMFLKGDEDEETNERQWAGEAYTGTYLDPRTGRRYYVADYGRYSDDPGSQRSESGMGQRLRHYTGEAVEGARHAAGWVADKVGDAAGSVKHAVGHAAGEASHLTGEAAGSAQHAVGDAASRSWESARHGMSRTAYRGREWSRAAARRTRSGYAYSRQRMENSLEEYPLAMSVAALAAGVLAGLAIPRSRREDRLFGEYAHELKHKAGDVASEAMHRGQLAAEREGLSPHTLADQAKDLARRASESASRVAGAAASRVGEVAKDVAETARDEARQMRQEAENRGLTPGSVGEKVKHVAKEAAKGAKSEGESGTGAKPALPQGNDDYSSPL